MKTLAFLCTLIVCKDLVACDQVMYDSLYKSIIMQAIHSKFTQVDIELKNNLIESLRKLCENQVSTWEKK